MRWSNAFMFNAMTFYFKEYQVIMKSAYLNGVNTFAPTSRQEFNRLCIES